jgi:hypothetical protein
MLRGRYCSAKLKWGASKRFAYDAVVEVCEAAMQLIAWRIRQALY